MVIWEPICVNEKSIAVCRTECLSETPSLDQGPRQYSCFPGDMSPTRVQVRLYGHGVTAIDLGYIRQSSALYLAR